MEDGIWTCVFSNDPPSKKRKRWIDGMLARCNGKLQLRDDSGSSVLGTSGVESSSSGGIRVSEGEDIRVGRYTVQVGEARGDTAGNEDVALQQGRVQRNSRPHVNLQRNSLQQASLLQRHRLHRGASPTIPALEDGGHSLQATSLGETSNRPCDDSASKRTSITRACDASSAPARKAESRIRIPGQIMARGTLGRATSKFKAPGKLLRHPTPIRKGNESEPLKYLPSGGLNQKPSSISAIMRDGRVRRPLSPPVRLEKQQPPRPQGQVQQLLQHPKPGFSGIEETPAVSTACDRPAPTAGTHLVRRNGFVTPFKVQKSTPDFSGSRAATPQLNRNGVTRKATLGAQEPPVSARQGGNDQENMPPFKLRFATPQPPLPQGQEHVEIREQKQGKQGSESPAAMPRWPLRTVWVPNGFRDTDSYRKVLSLALQEEMQLKLDETVVTRFEKVDTRLIASTTRARTDRRNPLWRQKHLRSEGINYYENASLFRAGGGGDERRGSGNRHKSDRMGGNGWGNAGKKRPRKPRMGDDSEDEDRGSKVDGADDLGKLYLKIASLSESKESSSAYGKGDVWAICASGRFLDCDEVIFCRSLWHGVSSQGMLSVGPLGDETEAQRLQELAGRGGGSSARSVHAIRCFNAQTDLSALDLLRIGHLHFDDEESPSRLIKPRGALSMLDSVPILPYLLSGTMGTANTGLSGGIQLSRKPSPNDVVIGKTSPCNPQMSKVLSSSSSSRKSASSEDVFDLCLTAQERDAEVFHTIEAFSLNQDQARLLWRCAHWFRAKIKADCEDDRSGVDTGGRESIGDVGAVTEGADAPVVLVHGVFGAGKSLSLVALCVMLDRIALADARERASQGLSPRPKEDEIRVLLAAGTNVAVDRVLMGLIASGFEDIARVGSHRRTHKSLLRWVVHNSPGRDAKQTAQSDLQDILRNAAVDERSVVAEALQATKRDSFTNDQAKRLREARVTGVTCASATTPLLTRSIARRNSSGGALRGRGMKAAVRGGLGHMGGGKVKKGTDGCKSSSAGQGYHIVVIDECSQIVEPLSLLPIAVARPRRLVLVGDPMQLPPPVAHARATTSCRESSSGISQSIGQDYTSNGLDAEREGWLEKANARRSTGDTLEKTLFVRLTALGIVPILLGRQYRCHPQLSGLANRLFYNGSLTDGISAADRAPLIPNVAPLTLVDTAGGGAESLAAGGSFRNVPEAQTVAALVSSLLRGGNGNGNANRETCPGVDVADDVFRVTPVTAASIGVICLYKAQLVEVQRQLQAITSTLAGPGTAVAPPRGEDGGRGETSTASYSPRDVQVCTVDAFQGAEKDIVIVATTRTERLGFIVSPRRLCVAVTRARHHLFIVGEKQVLLTNFLWKEIMNTSSVVTRGKAGYPLR